jgi:hypothetical protein
MNVLVGLEFDHGYASLSCDRQNNNHGAITCRKCRYLRLTCGLLKALVNRGNIFHHQRFQPALGMQPPLRVVARLVCATHLAINCRKNAVLPSSEPALGGADPKDNLRRTLRQTRFLRKPGAGELQAVMAKCNFGRGKNERFCFRIH